MTMDLCKFIKSQTCYDYILEILGIPASRQWGDLLFVALFTHLKMYSTKSGDAELKGFDIYWFCTIPL